MSVMWHSGTHVVYAPLPLYSFEVHVLGLWLPTLSLLWPPVLVAYGFEVFSEHRAGTFHRWL
jgi:hypothetical protein